MQRGTVLPRIGVMAVGFAGYWPQFPDMRGQLLATHARLNALFAGKGEIFEAGMVDNATSARHAGAMFAAAGIDILFVHLTTYANSETLLPAVRSLGVPIILLNVQPVRTLDLPQVRGIDDWLGVAVTPASVPEMTNVLIRLGKRFDTITGHLDGDAELEPALDLWCRLAGLTRRLSSQSLALLGRPFAGMMDLNLDETRIFRSFGTYVHHLDWDDIVAEFDAVTPAERESGVAALRTAFPASETLSTAEFEAAGTVTAALQRFVEKYHLLGIASHFEGKAEGRRAEVLAALNPALSVLNGQGIASPVEADIKAAFAMLILRTIGGSATLAELYSMDFDADVVIIGHSGAGDPAISATPPRLAMSEVFHGKSGRGYLTQFYPGPGPVTLLSLTQDATGDFRMVAAEGEIVAGPAIELGDTNSRVRFPGGLRRFIRAWSALGPTDHGVLGYGHHTEALQRASIALNLPLDIVRA
ncbi:MAG: sugar isomerase [Devosia sp.]|nr:sugar isomerase [Devosia sp.]